MSARAGVLPTVAQRWKTSTSTCAATTSTRRGSTWTAFLQRAFPSRTTEAEVAHTLRCLSAVDFQVQRSNTAALKVPTLTAWAEHDRFIEAPVMAEHAAALPSGPRLTWPEGGHNIQKSHACELAEVLVTMAGRSEAPASFTTCLQSPLWLREKTSRWYNPWPSQSRIVPSERAARRTAAPGGVT